MTGPRSDPGTLPIGKRFPAAYGWADATAVAARYDPIVICDVNVPHGRFTLRGPTAIADLLRTEEFRPGYRLTSYTARATPDGAVVEFDCRFESGGAERLAREVHPVRDRNGRIIDHVGYCTGIWDVATMIWDASTIQRREQPTAQP